MKLGILQGRLSPPNGGFQEFPKNWKNEFKNLETMGLKHIDWLVTKNCLGDSNPLFHEDLSSLKIGSICADNLVDTRIATSTFLFTELHKICESAIKNNIGTITIPLLEQSELSDGDKRARFIDNMNELANNWFPTLIFSFEIESYHNVITDIIYSNDNFRLTYDTGNMTSLGINHEYYIDKYINKIDTVHIKDRLYDGTTVSPGTGKTDFKSIFNHLRSLNDNGINYTIQTDRETDGDEVNTISKHKKIIEELYG
tara:strand:+ start:7817 stop:8584 length:768 start_codon:yes stop_codon:yes gene_type:complete